MNITNEQLRNIIQEELESVLSEFEEKEITDPCVWKDQPSHRPPGISQPKAAELCAAQSQVEEAAKKKPCKKAKGKKFVKRVDGRCRSYGDSQGSISPGTKKGDAYCARSLKIKKCKNPPCANALSRKKWKCKGAKSQK
jgi:hypothetical protein